MPKVRCLQSYGSVVDGQAWVHPPGHILDIEAKTQNQQDDLNARIAAGQLELVKAEKPKPPEHKQPEPKG